MAMLGGEQKNVGAGSLYIHVTGGNPGWRASSKYIYNEIYTYVCIYVYIYLTGGEAGWGASSKGKHQ